MATNSFNLLKCLNGATTSNTLRILERKTKLNSLIFPQKCIASSELLYDLEASSLLTRFVRQTFEWNARLLKRTFILRKIDQLTGQRKGGIPRSMKQKRKVSVENKLLN